MEFQIGHVAETLREAVELFEMDDRCNEVGTDEWVWLQRARMTLDQLDGSAVPDADTILYSGFEPIEGLPDFEITTTVVEAPVRKLECQWQFGGYLSVDQDGTVTYSPPSKFESIVVDIEVTDLNEPSKELKLTTELTNDEILFSPVG